MHAHRYAIGGRVGEVHGATDMTSLTRLKSKDVILFSAVRHAISVASRPALMNHAHRYAMGGVVGGRRMLPILHRYRD